MNNNNNKASYFIYHVLRVQSNDNKKKTGKSTIDVPDW